MPKNCNSNIKKEEDNECQTKKVVFGLKKEKDAFPHKVSKIRLEETHISWILLTGLYAYKIKKELKFGKVLDFSTLKLRKKVCQKEVTY